MRKLNTTTITFIAFATLVPLTGCANPNATIRVSIVDEYGKPIQGVHSEVVSTYTYDITGGLTDANGMYSVHLDKIYDIGGYFQKNGYYKTSGEFWKAPQWGDVPPADTNFAIVLKQIIDPVPMIRKDINAFPPRQGEPVGFDLEVGDWVFPDGKGKITDMLVTAEGKNNSMTDFSYLLSVEFLGENNGFYLYNFPPKGVDLSLRSELLPPQLAPETGYNEKLIEHFARSSLEHKWGISSRDGTSKLIFRVRTVVDDEGNIVSANYGWTSTDLYIAQRSNGITGFSLNYYYNPDPKSRSLEPKEIADRQVQALPKEEK